MFSFFKKKTPPPESDRIDPVETDPEAIDREEPGAPDDLAQAPVVDDDVGSPPLSSTQVASVLVPPLPAPAAPDPVVRTPAAQAQPPAVPAAAPRPLAGSPPPHVSAPPPPAAKTPWLSRLKAGL